MQPPDAGAPPSPVFRYRKLPANQKLHDLAHLDPRDLTPEDIEDLAKYANAFGDEDDELVERAYQLLEEARELHFRSKPKIKR